MSTQTQVSTSDKYMPAIAGILLGLAPFFPAPHIFGKVKWLLGGGAITGKHPMGAMDWFDLALHGIPLLFGISYLFYLLFIAKSD